jgi:hypothetical protein
MGAAKMGEVGDHGKFNVIGLNLNNKKKYWL